MPMTYAELSQAIQDYTQNTEATFVSNLPVFVRQAEQRIYNAAQMPAFRKSTTSTLTPSNRYLTAPTDFLAPFEMSVYGSDGVYHNLLFKDVGWMREAFPDPTVTGVPDYYALYNATTFLFSRTPDIAYTAEVHYFGYPTSLVDVNSGTYTWLSEFFDSVLLYGCLVEAYIFMKGEPDLIATYDTKYKEALQLMKTLGDGKDRIDTYRILQTRVPVP